MNQDPVHLLIATTAGGSIFSVNPGSVLSINQQILVFLLSAAMITGLSMPAMAETSEQVPMEAAVDQDTTETDLQKTVNTEATEEVLEDVETENNSDISNPEIETANQEVVSIGTDTYEAVSLDATFETGIYKVNGQYVYYLNGARQYTTNVIKVNGIWYNLVKGVVTANTVAKNSSGWWYINSYGQVDFKFTGIAKNTNGWWYCKNGKVQFNVNDVLKTTCNGVKAWYNIRGGKLVANTVAKNSSGWWYIDKYGKVDFDYNGIGKNASGTWYIKNGKVQFGYSGNYYANSTRYVVKNGKVTYYATMYICTRMADAGRTPPVCDCMNLSGNKLYIRGYYWQKSDDGKVPNSYAYRSVTLTLSSSTVYMVETDGYDNPYITKAKMADNMKDDCYSDYYTIYVVNGIVTKISESL